jgi:uncharacterized protein (TIGR03032 family)
VADSTSPNEGSADASGSPSEQRSVIRASDKRQSGFQLVTSRGFDEWLAGERMSLALTTYQVGGLLLLGLKPNRDVSIYAAAFDRSMGLWSNGQSLWLATANSIWRMENCLADGAQQDGFDRMYVPRVSYTTGDLDVHDLAIDADGRPVFVNTRFSCLATVDERFSFQFLWKPSFITSISPEDRCHLNGLALQQGRPKYVTAVAKCDAADAWRDFRDQGGMVIDVETNEIVAEGLSMPHSPRLYRDRLWLLNSGTGHLGYIDFEQGRFEPVTFIPGYARGLAFHGDYAVVGISNQRREHAFRGLALEQNLAEKGAVPRCGLQVIEVASGSVVHWARIESKIEELYDVAILPGVVRPKALSFATPTIGHQFCYEQDGRVEHWSSRPSSSAR